MLSRYSVYLELSIMWVGGSGVVLVSSPPAMGVGLMCICKVFFLDLGYLNQ